jgi:hypothetical protein
MWLDEVLTELTPLQRDIVIGFLRGEGPADDALARRYSVPPAEVRIQRFLACDRLKGVLKRMEAEAREAERRIA